VVEIAPLPGPAQRVRSTFPLPLSGKALVPALRGTYTYVRSVARAEPTRQAAVILVSDGVLDPLCGSTEAAAVAEARAAREGAPRIETRVVALGAGPSLLDPGDLADLAPLDRIAAAGGTGLAERVEINLLPDDALTTAIQRAVTEAEPCAFIAPEPPPAAAHIEWQGDASEPVAWPLVRSAAVCGASPGYFVRDTDPTRLELCPESCRQLRLSRSGSATLVDGCTASAR
jgi:hypothetical protein